MTRAPRVFLSYRRDDSAFHATTIYDHLVEWFGDDSVFMDVDNIPAGRDFRVHLRMAIEQCDVCVVLIGEKWLDVRNAAGQRRLEDERDYVRIEVESALERDIAVIPLLISGTSMPLAEQLPPSMADLVFRQALTLRSAGRDRRSDMQHLQEQIRSTVGVVPASVRPTGGIVASYPADVAHRMDGALDRGRQWLRRHVGAGIGIYLALHAILNVPLLLQDGDWTAWVRPARYLVYTAFAIGCFRLCTQLTERFLPRLATWQRQSLCLSLALMAGVWAPTLGYMTMDRAILPEGRFVLEAVIALVAMHAARLAGRLGRASLPAALVAGLLVCVGGAAAMTTEDRSLWLCSIPILHDLLMAVAVVGFAAVLPERKDAPGAARRPWITWWRCLQWSAPLLLVGAVAGLVRDTAAGMAVTDAAAVGVVTWCFVLACYAGGTLGCAALGYFLWRRLTERMRGQGKERDAGALAAVVTITGLGATAWLTSGLLGKLDTGWAGNVVDFVVVRGVFGLVPGTVAILLAGPLSMRMQAHGVTPRRRWIASAIAAAAALLLVTLAVARAEQPTWAVFDAMVWGVLGLLWLSSLPGVGEDLESTSVSGGRVGPRLPTSVDGAQHRPLAAEATSGSAPTEPLGNQPTTIAVAENGAARPEPLIAANALREVSEARRSAIAAWTAVSGVAEGPVLTELLRSGRELAEAVQSAFAAARFAACAEASHRLVECAAKIREAAVARGAAERERDRAEDLRKRAHLFAVPRHAAATWVTCEHFLAGAEVAYGQGLFDEAKEHWREARRELQGAVRQALPMRRTEVERFVSGIDELLRSGAKDAAANETARTLASAAALDGSQAKAVVRAVRLAAREGTKVDLTEEGLFECLGGTGGPEARDGGSRGGRSAWRARGLLALVVVQVAALLGGLIFELQRFPPASIGAVPGWWYLGSNLGAFLLVLLAFHAAHGKRAGVLLGITGVCAHAAVVARFALSACLLCCFVLARCGLTVRDALEAVPVWAPPLGFGLSCLWAWRRHGGRSGIVGQSYRDRFTVRAAVLLQMASVTAGMFDEVLRWVGDSLQLMGLLAMVQALGPWLVGRWAEATGRQTVTPEDADARVAVWGAPWVTAAICGSGGALVLRWAEFSGTMAGLVFVTLAFTAVAISTARRVE